MDYRYSFQIDGVEDLQIFDVQKSYGERCSFLSNAFPPQALASDEYPAGFAVYVSITFLDVHWIFRQHGLHKVEHFFKYKTQRILVNVSGRI